MSTNSLLINFAGYPVSPRNFVPDNGLAALAGSLISAGHRTMIMDYSTVDVVKKIFPYEYHSEIKELVNRINADIKKHGAMSTDDLRDFRSLDVDINKFQKSRILDIAEDLNKMVRAEKIDFVGFKLFLGDAFEGSIIIAEYLKQHNPSLKIFAGGPHVDLFMERIFSITGCFDALAYGEGEEIIVSLAEYAEGRARLHEIPNLMYKEGGAIIKTAQKRVADLNALPDPIYDTDVYPAMAGNNKIKIILIDESRGCPNSCSFCCHPVKSGNKWRKKDPVRIVDFMEKMSVKHGIKAFRFSGSNPPPDLKRSIAEEIIKRGLNIKYTSFAYAKNVKNEDFSLLKRSGCYSIFFGIESGSREILAKSMNKRIDINEVRNAVKKSKEAGLKVVGSVIMPAPFETEETRKETYDLLMDLQLDGNDVCFPSPTPCTKWGEESGKYNFDLGEKEEFWNKAIKYSLKTFYPQVLWDSFPQYKLNGKNFPEITAETTAFVRALEGKGLLTQVTDEVLLMAEYSGLGFRDFRNRWNESLYCGEHSEIQQLTGLINNSILS